MFYEGPPTANGRPGIHHVWARLFKDLYPRFHTMRGKHVARKGGWDCHGLPVEVEVEKELGFSAKFEIEDYGIERFNARCRASVQRYVEDWQSLTARIGMWLDTAGAYWTLSNDYIESVWWLFHEIWDAGAIYEGYKVVPYCGRCGTALSSHELGQPGAYRDVTEPSVYVRFPLVDRAEDLLVWTTTPWTLPSNVGAAIGPGIDYVQVRAPEGGRDLVMARARVADVLGTDAVIVGPVERGVVGRSTIRAALRHARRSRGTRVHRCRRRLRYHRRRVGHRAPRARVRRDRPRGRRARGAADRQSRQRRGPLRTCGRRTLRGTLRQGHRSRSHRGAHPPRASSSHWSTTHTPTRTAGAATRRSSTGRSRRGSPRTSAYKSELIAENETINWYPEHIKHGRFGDWLENNVDWALSRDRYWGTPIPVWRCHDCRHDTCVGSVDELAKLSGRDLTGMDLHRPYVDDVTITCPRCERGTAYRIEAVLDAWFDSGSMPAAQFHHPFGANDEFDTHFPADFICEAIDQTRGWFYSLLAVNTLAFGKTPYRNVVCLAHIVDKDGLKMSKSRGNVIDPVPVLAERGADALRWYMLSSGSPWTPKRVSIEGIDEATRQFLLTLWNTYSFFVTYANIDGWSATSGAAPGDEPVHVLDRWITSQVHRTVRTATEALEQFDALAATQALAELVDDLSNWYVRRSRARFWKSSDPVAHATLHGALLTLSRLLAPFCPFFADELFRNLANTDESVHLGDWPGYDDDAIDDALETEMALARTLVSLGRAARADAKLGVRQPLPRAIALLSAGEGLRDEVAQEIKDELNVKQLEVVDSLEGLLSYKVVPNFRTLGPRLGKLAPRVKALLEHVDGSEVRSAFDNGGSFSLTVDGEEVVLEPHDVEIRAEQHADLTLAQDGPHAVALDLTLDDDLRAEGLAREIIRAVNDRRKAHGFELSDRITVELRSTVRVVDAAARHATWIKTEVLATDFDVTVETLESAPDASIDGEPLWLELRRV